MDPSFTTFRDSSAPRRSSQKSASANKRASKSSKHKHKIKKSGVRTEFLIESLRHEYYQQREENEWLRQLVVQHLPQHKAQEILASCYDPDSAVASQKKLPSSNKELDELAAKMMPELTMAEGDGDSININNTDDNSGDEDMSDDDAVGF